MCLFNSIQVDVSSHTQNNLGGGPGTNPYIYLLWCKSLSQLIIFGKPFGSPLRICQKFCKLAKYQILIAISS